MSTNGTEVKRVASPPAPVAPVFIKKSAAKIPAPVPGGAVKIAPSGAPVKMTASVAYEVPSNYEPILKNIYVCRDELKLRPHELPRCSCKEGQRCTPNDCENSSVFIECSPERCSLGKDCQNQRFQKRQYAGIRPARCGAKGWGIFADLPISAGQFVIEYVGEVIDSEELEIRSKACASAPHYYFLSLTGGETIDASKKGNISRFINHSCDPNCVTQKWQVGGESRVGIFALRSIKIGEELTFDYQFERFSQKKQRCLCGAANCSKYLGSKPKPKDGEKKPKKKDKVIYKEVSEAILPDEHVVLLLDDQPVDTFPFKPVDENWYCLPSGDIPQESDTEVESSSDDSESEDVASDDESVTSTEPQAKIAKLEEGATPSSNSVSPAPAASSNGHVSPPSNGTNAVDDESSSESEHPRHPAREYVNAVATRPPIFRKSNAHQQRLYLLDQYSDLLYDAIDTQKERKSLTQDAELAAMSRLTGLDTNQAGWMASLDIKQLMKDGLLEFSPRSEADRGIPTRSTRAKR